MCWGARPRRALPWETLTPRADNENPPGPRVRTRRGSLPPGLPVPRLALRPPARDRPPTRASAASRSWSQSVIPTTVYEHLWLARILARPANASPGSGAQARGRPFTGWRKAITARGGDGPGKAAGRAARRHTGPRSRLAGTSHRPAAKHPPRPPRRG